MQAVGCNSLKVTFRVKNEIEWLTGDFKACGGGTCRSVSVGSFDKGRDQNKMVAIPTINLSPCKSYSFQITSKLRGDKGEKRDNANWQAKAFGNCCPELTSKAPAITTTTTHEDDASTSPAGNTTPPVSGSEIGTAAIGIVVGVVLVALIVTALVTIILFKRKRERKKKQEEVMPVDENPVYGIYDDGALYNVVEDGNVYYES